MDDATKIPNRKAPDDRAVPTDRPVVSEPGEDVTGRMLDVLARCAGDGGYVTIVHESKSGYRVRIAVARHREEYFAEGPTLPCAVRAAAAGLHRIFQEYGDEAREALAELGSFRHSAG